MKGTTEKPSGVISCPLIVGAASGFTNPHLLPIRIPKTASPRPATESTDPMTSSLGGCSAFGAWAICPRSRMITVTITVSPANT